MSGWKSEEELAKAVSVWLRADGWETWHEVCDTGGARADIVATRGQIVHVVECKLRLGLEVLAQADHWRWRAHFVSVATPPPRRYGKTRDFVLSVAAQRGIGVITAYDDRRCKWREESGSFFRTADAAKLRGLLTAEHKVSIPGRAGSVPYHTPFKETCKRVLETVRKAGGRAPVRATIEAIKHHYAHDRSAIGCLVRLTRDGVVPGMELEKDGRALFFVAKKAAVQ